MRQLIDPALKAYLAVRYRAVSSVNISLFMSTSRVLLLAQSLTVLKSFLSALIQMYTPFE